MHGALTLKLHNSESHGLSTKKLPSGIHLCDIFENNDERLSLIYHFLEAGCKNREQLLAMEAPGSSDEIRDYILDRDSDFLSSKQLKILAPGRGESYDEFFSPDKVLNLIQHCYLGAAQSGYSGVRLSGEMAYLIQRKRGRNDYLKFEAELNLALKQYPCTTICHCNLNLLSGSELMDVLSVHPFALIRGQIFENPFFIPPIALLKSYTK